METVAVVPPPERQVAKPAAKPVRPAPASVPASVPAPAPQPDTGLFDNEEQAPPVPAEHAQVTTTDPPPAGARAGAIQADIDHLRRAWPVLLEAVKKRQAGLSAVLAEGRPDSLEGGELVVKFPAGYGFQADQLSRGENPKVVAEALKEITGRSLRVVAKVAVEQADEPAAEDEDARILSKDELIRVLKQEFDAQIIDDGPAR
jgi:hypothetical protein